MVYTNRKIKKEITPKLRLTYHGFVMVELGLELGMSSLIGAGD